MRAVSSVLEQSLTPHEIIVVDDGSNDGTSELFASVDARVRYVEKGNGGVSSARNRGIQESTGDWVAFLDSDDTWLPDKLEKQVEAVTAHSAGICFTGVVTEQGERATAISGLAPEIPQGQSAAFDCPIEFMTRSDHHPMIQSLLIKRELLDAVGGFDETLHVAEDTQLFYMLVASFRVVLLNSPLVMLTRERETPGLSDSVEIDQVTRRVDCYLRVQLNAYQIILMKADNLAPETFSACAVVTRKRISHFLMQKMELYLAQGQHAKAQAHAKECLGYANTYKFKIKSLLTLLLPKIASARARDKWLN